MEVPDLFFPQPNESSEQLTQRQREQSDFVFFADARGVSGENWGDCWMVAPGNTSNEHQDDIIIDWNHRNWPALYEHSSIKEEKKLNIAILEMLTTIRGLFAFLSGTKAIRPHPTNPLHIHVLTDNEVSYHRMLKNKGTHPIVPFLLRALSRLQMDHNAMFTYATIPSEENRFTDAGSRNWKSKYGPQAFARSQTCEANPGVPNWWTDIQKLLEASPNKK
jgi:hypothetical protein